MENIAENNQKQKKTNMKLFIAIISLLLAVLIGTIAFFVIRGGQAQPDRDSGGVGYVVDPNAGKFVEQTTEAAEQKPGVAIPGWGSITIPPMTTELTNMVNFYNPDANKYLYYLTFEIRLPDDSEQGYEVLYSSQLVPPGECIQSITLSRGLPEGEYDAVIHVQPFTMGESRTPTNNADMNTTLIVK